MAETTMPAAEAAVDTLDIEKNSYELAFHILPTVAEGEVLSVFETLKADITKVGGEITLEEAPERVDLAYDIIKSLEGKNRKFSSAYFGWIRFTLESGGVEQLNESMDSNTSVLRYLVIKLTRVEEENPFNFHEKFKSDKMVKTVGEESDVLADPLSNKEEKVVSKEESPETKNKKADVETAEKENK